MVTRRTLLGSAAAAAALGQGRKPNFLFLIADDHAGYVMGCDGNTRAKTPNLDRLASEGVRFASHYCNSPVCTPSRQSFLTGLLPHTAGVTVLQTPLSDGSQTLARQFQRAGYHTAVFGKMHFNRDSEPGLHGFETMMAEREIKKAWQAEPVRKAPPPDLKRKPVWKPFIDPARIWLNAEKLPYPRYYEEMRGTFTARQAMSYLEKHKADPFALWVSFPEPHSPYDFPIDDASLFSPSSFTPPRVGTQDGPQIPLIFRDLSPEEKQGIIASYYTAVHMMDRNVGDVLAKLDQLGLASNTYVVYIADHGYSLGQHGRFEKHCGYDPALRVPLLMRFPGRISKGTVVNRFTESIDVAPTIADVMGIDHMPEEHGESLRAHLEGRPAARGRDAIFSEYLENEEAYLRTDRWKFIYCTGRRKRTDGYVTDNPTPGRYVRLYDLKSDPDEFHNVSSAHPEVVQDLKRRLLARFRSTHREAMNEPPGPDALDFYLRPRDAV